MIYRNPVKSKNHLLVGNNCLRCSLVICGAFTWRHSAPSHDLEDGINSNLYTVCSRPWLKIEWKGRPTCSLPLWSSNFALIRRCSFPTNWFVWLRHQPFQWNLSPWSLLLHAVQTSWINWAWTDSSICQGVAIITNFWGELILYSWLWSSACTNSPATVSPYDNFVMGSGSLFRTTEICGQTRPPPIQCQTERFNWGNGLTLLRRHRVDTHNALQTGLKPGRTKILIWNSFSTCCPFFVGPALEHSRHLLCPSSSSQSQLSLNHPQSLRRRSHRHAHPLPPP